MWLNQPIAINRKSDSGGQIGQWESTATLVWSISDTLCSNLTGWLRWGSAITLPTPAVHQAISWGVWLPGGPAANLGRTKRTKSETTTSHSRRALPQFPPYKIAAHHYLSPGSHVSVRSGQYATNIGLCGGSENRADTVDGFVFCAGLSIFTSSQWCVCANFSLLFLKTPNIAQNYQESVISLGQICICVCHFCFSELCSVPRPRFYNIHNICAAWHCILYLGLYRVAWA